MFMKITSNFLREKFLKFFADRGHAVIQSTSLIPENDPSVLFTTAGMHPLIPYLLGQKHPKGTRLCDVQKCVRTGDIEEVGDDSHLTFFEMLGNWSLGDYFNHESIKWSYEFLTSPEYLGLDVNRISVTVFAGDEDAPRDEDSANVWKACGIPAERIFYLPK
ncbi:MAG: alanine--tRNA ligase, partial [Clostridia bacterium]|nr:alanine--tRNA ligase [Clostridia bacterium]